MVGTAQVRLCPPYKFRRHCERSEAIHAASPATVWIASSLALLTMTAETVIVRLSPTAAQKRPLPDFREGQKEEGE